MHAGELASALDFGEPERRSFGDLGLIAWRAAALELTPLLRVLVRGAGLDQMFERLSAVAQEAADRSAIA